MQAGRRAALAVHAGLLAILAIALIPTAASAQLPMPEASWNGAAIESPRPNPRTRRTAWPVGWSARGVRLGDGYAARAGSTRVKDVQRRLKSLGYRPGP